METGLLLSRLQKEKKKIADTIISIRKVLLTSITVSQLLLNMWKILRLPVLQTNHPNEESDYFCG